MYANDKQILLIIVFFPYTCNDIRSAQSTMHPGPGLLIPSCFTDAGETGEDIIITRGEDTSVPKSSIRRFVITEKAPTRAFSWLKAATTAFTFKTLLRHYAKRGVDPTVSQREIGSATQLS